MPSVAESLGARLPLAAGLAAGVDQISSNQTITFTMYVRLVLPLDGFVFWVRADLVDATALPVPPGLTIAANATTTVSGSLHYASDTIQGEDEGYTRNRVVFTAENEIQAFNDVGGSVLFIGEFEGVRFAFNGRRSFYKQAGLHHYFGDAIYPTLETQIIDSLAGFDQCSLVVSNSLPIWLSINRLFPVFPSFLVPDNVRPPYATAHVLPESQRALQGAVHFDRRSTGTQLVSEKVRVTLYGVRNDTALDYVKEVNLFTILKEAMGVMNMPVVRDEKRTQSELTVIAMKKSVEFEINYYQRRVNDLARQLILKVIPSYTFGV